MNPLMRELSKERDYLAEIIAYAESVIAKAPPGNVRGSKCGNSIQFYYYDEFTEKRNGEYIPKRDREKARKIVEKEYLQKLKKTCMERKTEIERAMQVLVNTEPQKVFSSMPEVKQQILSKVLVDDKEYADIWQNKSYSNKPFPENYPDFRLLNMNTREEIILEHLGMMDDMEYVEKALRKIRLYERNGYFLGKQLFITFETAQEPFDSRIFENMLKEMGFSGKTW